MIKYDIIIIGAGLIGIPIAYELAKAGRKVAVVDAKGLGAGASTANGGMLLLEGNANGPAFSMRMDGVGEYQKLEEELEYKIDFQKRTLIELIEDEKYIQEASEIGALYKRNGFFGEIIDTAEIHKLEPGVCLDTVISALLAEQWTIDPMKTLFGYYLKAREYGMDWYPFAPVMDFIREGTKILGVKTPKGDIFGDQIVTAVGAMTRPLLQKVGVTLPEYYIHGSAMITERGKYGLKYGILKFASDRIEMQDRASEMAERIGWENMPEMDALEFCAVPDGEGSILIAERSHIWKDYRSAVPIEDMRLMARNTLKYLPGLRQANIVRSWIRPVPFIPDNRPFYGYLRPYDNLFVASGFASALIVAPVVAKMTRDLLEGKKAAYDISSFDPSRFN